MNELSSMSFSSLPMAANMALFVLAAAVVWIAGTRLAIIADVIADRKRIGKALMGLLFLAAATELPELVTTISAAMKNNAALVLNNMFGGITMQTAILAVADGAVIHATLTSYPRKTTLALEGILLILLLGFLLAIISLNDFFGDFMLFGRIGIGTVMLGFAYIAVIQFLRFHEANARWRPLDFPDEGKAVFGGTGPQDFKTMPLARLYGFTAIAVLSILVAGLLLVQLAEVLALQSGLGSSFVGVTLLAASTSLPELSTTIAAVRIGAFTMAISNIFGSNLIMLALLLPADMFYEGGRILEQADRSARFALLSGIMVTSVYVIGLLMRSKRRFFALGYDSLIVLVLYLASLVVFFVLR